MSEILSNLEASMRVHRISVSFTIGNKDETNRGATQSYEVTCADPEGWTMAEAELVELLAQKYLVKSVYRAVIVYEGMNPQAAKRMMTDATSRFQTLIDRKAAKMETEEVFVQELKSARAEAAESVIQ